MTADDTVTAKLAEWGALVHENTEGDLRADLPPIARALLGFVEDVRALHQPVAHNASNDWAGDPFTECRECRHTWPCPTVQALTKRIGGEG